MAKFKIDDRVVAVKGRNIGIMGRVTDPYFQISQSDWPFVHYKDENGVVHSDDESRLELFDDPYEYALSMKDHKDEWKVVGDIMDRYNRTPVWGALEPRERLLEWYNKDFTHTEFKLVKRRKAGKVEDV